VIITQRGHGSVMARRTVSPMTTVRPIRSFSMKPGSSLPVVTMMLGRNRRASKTAPRIQLPETVNGGCGQQVHDGNVEKRPGRHLKVSVTGSLYSRPAMSGQYSSATPEGICSARASTKAISRRNARERICFRSARSLLTTSPSGSVIRTGEIRPLSFGASP
jgi:hypothetical protein